MKNIFIQKNLYTIYTLVGILLIISNFFISSFWLIALTFNYWWIQYPYRAIVKYNKSKKLNPELFISAFVFLSFFVIIFVNNFN